MNKKIVFLMGVSGSGKTTILNSLLMNNDNLVLVPSYVTREMRINEKNGRKYWFISNQEFEDAIKKGEFLEYAIVHGKNYYGTKFKEIEQAWSKNKLPIKELDMFGLEKIRKEAKIDGQYISIFLDIPDDTMVARILQRDTMSHEELERRLQSAKRERHMANQICDHIVDASVDVESVIAKVSDIVKNTTQETLF